MKQRITVEQLKELNGKQQQFLRESYSDQQGDWFYRSTVNDTGIYGGSDDWATGDFTLTKREAIDLPLFSIGRMIEIVEEVATSEVSTWEINHDWHNYTVKVISAREKDTTLEASANNLCDALWNAVKMIIKSAVGKK